METQVFRASDGHEIKADLYLSSREKNDQKSPAILFIHGGGLIMGSRKMIAPNHVQAFHKGGFHVVSIDYRLAPETKLPDIVDDLKNAWRWLRENAESYGIDSDRIAVAGHSAGGFLTLLSGYELAPRPIALVSMAGYGKLTHAEFENPSSYYVHNHAMANELEARSAVGEKALSESSPNDSMHRYLGRGLFYLYCRQQGIWLHEVSGRHPSDQEWFARYEPIRNITAAYPPTLLLHGETDTDVPYDQSILMQRELERHGVVHELVSNPDWGHAFIYATNDPTVDQALQQIVAFLHKHI